MRAFFKPMLAGAWLLALGLAAASAAAAPPLQPIPEDQGANGLGLALRRLPVGGRVLYVTAHPDDENNAVLVALSRGRGLDVSLLTLTRGEGGQNAIGSELGEALGVLRTEELAAVHRFDGVRQLFGAAYEFGFSFSLEETFAKWGRDDTLGDVVFAVRRVRPDVILTLPLEAPDHQHHVAAARLAAEAFRAAADPGRFPDQIQGGLRPWQARKIYQGGVGDGSAAAAVRVPVSNYDPLLGMSWAEFGSLARTFHRCQATSQLAARPGDWPDAGYRLVDAEPPTSATESDILDGIDVSLAGWRRFAPGIPGVAPALASIDGLLRGALAAFDDRAPERSVPALADALAALRRLEAGLAPGEDPERRELDERLGAKIEQVENALAVARGVVFDVTSDDGDVVPGQSFTVTALIANRGPEALRVEDVTLAVPEAWRVEPPARGDSGELLAPGQRATRAFVVTVSPGAPASGPYWAPDPGRDRYRVREPRFRGLPWEPPLITGFVRYAATDSVAARLSRAASFRYEGRWVGGEKRKSIDVVPALSVRLSPELAVFPAGAAASREFRVGVTNGERRSSAGRVSLRVPAGWSVSPAAAELRFDGEGAAAEARFTVRAPAGAATDEARITAIASRDAAEFGQGVQVVAYDHIEERHLIRPAVARGLRVDVKVGPGVAVGYVMGVGDQVADAIRQLDAPLQMLSEDDLAFGDLSRYTTIVLGVRAYQARADLRANQRRLMEYAEAGGNLLVQYNRSEFNPKPDAPSPFAPYPARVSSRRVTDETAPMRVLQPEAPVLVSPNRIGARDWEGWVQERGIQLLDATDSRYTDLLAAADPFPKNPAEQKGLLVEARVGRGSWTYCGLVLFRELPAGNPGAYRLLANLISRPRQK